MLCELYTVLHSRHPPSFPTHHVGVHAPCILQHVSPPFVYCATLCILCYLLPLPPSHAVLCWHATWHGVPGFPLSPGCRYPWPCRSCCPIIWGHRQAVKAGRSWAVQGMWGAAPKLGAWKPQSFLYFFLLLCSKYWCSPPRAGNKGEYISTTMSYYSFIKAVMLKVSDCSSCMNKAEGEKAAGGIEWRKCSLQFKDLAYYLPYSGCPSLSGVTARS